MKYLIAILSLTFSISSFADVANLKDLFSKIETVRKGAFGLNMLQGKTSRVTVKSGGSPAGGVLFLAAYRNELAVRLLNEEDFYVGNLFTTNYYETMGKYAYGNRDANHALDHEKLLERSETAMPETYNMVRHWVLERHYVNHFPDSGLAQGFTARGVAGSEYEAEYANYFFDFYFSSIQNDEQYLVGFLLLQQAPIKDTRELQQARDLISKTYDYFKGQLGSKNKMVQSIWDLRNAIHNQLHPGVIDAIDRFFKDFPSYQRDGHTYLGKIQSILRKYYAVTASSLVETANSLELTEIADIANSIGQKEPSIEELVSLASAAANTRSQMSQIKPVKMAETILLLSNVSNYISSSMSKKIASAGNSMNLDTYKKLVEASVHLAYVEGLLITDNWSFLASEARSTNRPQRLLSDVIAFSTITLESAMELPLQKWSAVNSGMEYFVDSAIKSSSLNGAGQLSRVSIQ